ncbi:hypothetical protein J6590_001244 [Homalodisca vitripennis]|nr:hypothetical protein J6590_001244 [Homalodisca vitripennis]
MFMFTCQTDLDYCPFIPFYQLDSPSPVAGGLLVPHSTLNDGGGNESGDEDGNEDGNGKEDGDGDEVVDEGEGEGWGPTPQFDDETTVASFCSDSHSATITRELE